MAFQKFNDKILEYAKNLYLTIDDKGKKLYTLRDIANKILQTHHKKIDFSSIGQWAKKNSWDVLLQAAKNLAIQKQSEQKDEQIIEALADDIAERRRIAMRKKSLADELIIRALENDLKENPGKLDIRSLQSISASEEAIIENLDGIRSPAEKMFENFVMKFNSFQDKI
jgi:hypothetical protein